MLALIQQTGGVLIDRRLTDLLFGLEALVVTGAVLVVLFGAARLVLGFICKASKAAPLRGYNLESLEPVDTPSAPGPQISADLPPLIERLRSIDWFQFEKLVAAMYRYLGYRVIR